MPLTGQTVDVPLIAMNQSWPVTAGPAGRLRQMENAVVSKYMATPSGIILRAQKRDGFRLLPTTVHNPGTGAVSSKTLASPVMLTTYGKQLIAVAGAAAFVLSEAAGCWESPTFTCPGDTLRAKPVLNRGGVLSTPDSARIGSRTMHTWVDISATGDHAMGMIVDDDGTVVLSPKIVGGGTVGKVKVLADGTQFWIVTEDNGGGPNIDVFAYTTDGVVLGSDTSLALTAGSYWDVAVVPNLANSITLAQKTNGGPGITFTRYTWTGAAVTVSSTTQAAFLCATGRVAFLRNDTGDGNLYLSTIDGAGPYDYYGWQATNPAAGVYGNGHQYTIATAQAALPFEATGFIAPTGNKDLTIALSVLETTPRPQENFTNVYTVTFAGVAVLQKVRRSLTVVSRPFRLKDGSYYVVGYYHADAIAIAGSPPESTFFLISLASYEVCGRWDWGTAYADWQVTTNTRYYMHVSTPTVSSDGAVHLPLAHRSSSKTAFSGSLFGIGFAYFIDTVAIFDYSFGADTGEPFEAYGELFIPGPQATSYASGVLTDDGIGLVPELRGAAAVAGGSLTASSPYQYVAVAEWTDGAGNRVRGPASPPANMSTTAGNKTGSVAGQNLHVSGKTNLLIQVYRTVIVNQVQSTNHYRVTGDLGASGTFSGPVIVNDDSTATWSLTDTMTDGIAAQHERLYTDDGSLDRFPCPPFKSGCAAFNRAFVLGYDGAVWFSGLKTEGDALWFNPAFRIVLPSQDEAIAVAALDNFLLIFCKGSSIYYLPSNGFPDNTGAGPVPTPTPLPFSNGCTGFALTTSDGVFYSSTQGGIWTVTRDLKNVFIGEAVADETAASTVVGIANDGKQRTAVLLNNGRVLLWDGIANAWGAWAALSVAPALITSHKGLLATISSAGVPFRQLPGAVADNDTLGNDIPIITTVEVVCHIGGVRNFKRVWNQQFQGERRGDHDLTVTETFDDDVLTVVETYGPFTPAAGVPYIYELPPKVEECSSVTLKFVDSFPRGASLGYALEMLAFDVGVLTGLGRLSPGTRRVRAT